MSNLAQSCSSLGATAQGHLFVTHVLPLLDTLELPEEARSKLRIGVALVKARWARYPQFDYQQRKVEIVDLMLRLSRNIRLKTAEEGLTERNDILAELVQAILEWSKQLWIVGVEFGEEGEFVHESLSFLYHSLIGFRASSVITCTCIVPSLDIEHVFLRSDGQLIDEFRGRANCVVRGALLQVWRDMILANLVKPENESDGCHFVGRLLPSFFKDILDMNQKHISILFKVLDPHTGHRRGDGRCGHRDDDDDDDDNNTVYGDGNDMDDDDDDDDDTGEETDASGDEMPPLMSVSDSRSEVSSTMSKKLKTKATKRADDKSESDRDDSESGESDVVRGEEWTDTDGSRSEAEIRKEVPPLTQELDREEERRKAAIPRLKRLIYTHVIEKVKQRPSAVDFELITGLRPDLTKELIKHYVTMIHNPTTFEGAVKVLIAESANLDLIKLLESNRDVGRRCPRAMQEATLYLTLIPAFWDFAVELLKSEVHSLVSAMVVEIEVSFEGLRDIGKKREAQEFHKMPASERLTKAKSWLHEVKTRSPESLSNDAQANLGANFGDPVDIFAAISASLGLAPPGAAENTFATPLYADPIEAQAENPADVDPELLERFRPNYVKVWNGWLATLADVSKRNPAGCLPIPAALCKDILVIAPYLAQNSLVTEMKIHCGTEATKHVKDIIAVLHSFIIEQRKVQIAAQKAREKKAAAVAAKAAVTAPFSNLAQVAAVSRATATAESSSQPSLAPSPAPSPAPSTPSSASPPPPTTTLSPVHLPAALYNLFGFTVPAALLGNGNAPPSPAPASAPNQPWDDVD
ncbi:hypothetical protein FRB98_001360 [Tulasnella sp. 332]|nr:hypothetical protein FRB98_001360 [Tulasnella sp. 332]